MALAGTLDFDPRKDFLTAADGTFFYFYIFLIGVTQTSAMGRKGRRECVTFILKIYMFNKNTIKTLKNLKKSKKFL